jgi:hypothetical protein
MKKFKNVKIFTSLGLTMFLTSAVCSPAKANLIPDIISKSLEKLKNNSSEELVEETPKELSQLQGHDTYDGKPQIEWDGYMLGRVVGKAGNILFVKLSDGTYFNDVGEGYPGNDVLVEEVDGRYHIVGKAHAPWISTLKSKYGWRRVTVSTNLNERTAAIWEELEANSRRSSTVSLPPRTSTPSYTPVESPMINEPIRGLY